MRIEILYFASLRESLGIGRESVDLPDAVADTAQLRTWLCARGGAWSECFAASRTVRVAVGQRMVGGSAPLGEGAEVAFFPPVTGG